MPRKAGWEVGRVPGFYQGSGAPTNITLAVGSYYVGDYYLDTTNKLLYVATTAGTQTSSLWTNIGPISGFIPLAALTSQVSGYKVEAWYSGSGAPTSGNLTAGNYGVGDRYWDTAGKQSYICITAGTANSSVWQADGGGSTNKTMQKIATHTAGGNESTFTFSGLAGDTDLAYEIRSRFVGGNTSATRILVRPNNDGTTSNYDRRFGNYTGGTFNDNIAGFYLCRYIYNSYGAHTSILTVPVTKSGAERGSYSQMVDIGNNLLVYATSRWLNTADPITSFVVLTDDGSSWGSGSVTELWAQR